jgi:transcriptional regulator with XRE-family HTH domain
MGEALNISEIDQYVIDFVRRLRKKHKDNQTAVGNIIKTGRTFITNVESPKHPAKYNLSHIDMLASHYGMSPREFLPENSLFEDLNSDKNLST